MNRLLTLLILISLLCCSQNKKNNKVYNTKIIEETESKKTESISQPKKKELVLSETEKEIIKISTSFHEWYIKNNNDMKSNIPTGYDIVKDLNGKCKLDYEP